MPTVEERLAYIEGRVEEHTRSMEEFRSGVLRSTSAWTASI
jgi:hypothetical protein